MDFVFSSLTLQLHFVQEAHLLFSVSLRELHSEALLADSLEHLIVSVREVLQVSRRHLFAQPHLLQHVVENVAVVRKFLKKVNAVFSALQLYF